MPLESLEFWKNAFEIAGVVLLLLTFVAGAGVLLFSKRVNAVQAGQLRQFDKGLTEARTELGKQQERAANADARVEGLRLDVAKAEQHSAEANAKTEGFRLDIAKAQESAAKAEAQVEGARAEAAKANLELARLKTPRTLSQDQQHRITARLLRFKGQKFDFNVYPESEPMALPTVLDSVLKAAGWERIPSQSGDVVVTVAGETAGTAYLNGVQAFVGPEDNSSIAALVELGMAVSDNGIPCTPHKTDQLKGKTPPAILIAVGNKPQP